MIKFWNNPFLSTGAGISLVLLITASVHAQDQIQFFNDTLSIGGESRFRGEYLDDYYNTSGSDVDDSRLSCAYAAS